MSANVEETLVEKVRALPADKQRALLDFVQELERSAAPESVTLWDKVRDIIEAIPPKHGKNYRRMAP